MIALRHKIHVMKRFLISAALLLTCCTMQQQSYAQGFLKKLKDKVEKKAGDLLDKKTGDASGTANNTNGNSSTAQQPVNASDRSGKPINKSGEALRNSSIPDVLQQMGEADQAYTAQQFGNTRFSIQQALLGIELQIGRSLLTKLPAAIKGLPKDTTEDRVMSTRYGWSNLTIQRTYRKDEQQISMTIGNSGLYAGMFDLYFGMATTQSNGEALNAKQIRIKGNKAIIKFDEQEGYTVLMQLGQSGMLSWQCINFNNETEVTEAIQAFDIDEIKKTIGEQ